jgi:putative peptide zinc metalloprotease protein
MGNYTEDGVVSIYPFTKQVEGEEVVIGRKDTVTFLSIPIDAFEILDELSKGFTIGQVRHFYQEKYEENPDIADLLNFLEVKGFVKPFIDGEKNIDHWNVINESNPVKKVKTSYFYFPGFPQSLAQKIFGRYSLVLMGVCIGFGLLSAIFEPSIIPNWNAFFFKENLTIMQLFLTLIGLLTLFLHEMAHLIAARALGIPSKIGISNRMWMLVAETDMTEIWSVPRNQRYLPFLAGPLFDSFCASLLAIILYIHKKGLITISPLGEQICKAILLSYLLGLLWQCYLFIRTDFYFVFANLFRCKSLMKDTEVLLLNQLAKFLPFIKKVSQSNIPIAERSIIRCYAVIWLIGRAIALHVLIFIATPLIWHYFLKISTILNAGHSENPSAFIDALLMVALVFIPQAYGLWLWVSSFRKKKRSQL